MQETETFSPFLNWYEFMFWPKKVIPNGLLVLLKTFSRINALDAPHDLIE